MTAQLCLLVQNITISKLYVLHAVEIFTATPTFKITLNNRNAKIFYYFYILYKFDFLNTKKISCTLDFCITFDRYLKATHIFILNAKKNKYKKVLKFYFICMWLQLCFAQKDSGWNKFDGCDLERRIPPIGRTVYIV